MKTRQEIEQAVAMMLDALPHAMGGGWARVSFAADCTGDTDDPDEPGDICSICGLDYCDDCQCPGPTQDGHEYREIDGVLMARPTRR
jgi:hypothetical protein